MRPSEIGGGGGEDGEECQFRGLGLCSFFVLIALKTYKSNLKISGVQKTVNSRNPINPTQRANR